eukprot:6551795-Alexandrium_andersonii.AAC.1
MPPGARPARRRGDCGAPTPLSSGVGARAAAHDQPGRAVRDGGSEGDGPGLGSAHPHHPG